MTCPNCGSGNEGGRKFCGQCGSPLAIACAVCGTPNAPGVRFCGECGTALGGAMPVQLGIPGAEEPITGNPSDGMAPNVRPTAERRLVSVLFADLVGFTTLAESRDAEEVRELLTRYFDTCGSLVARYGGVIEKFIGDAVMAVWGTPITNEDDAERAVRAALELTEAVVALGEEVGIPTLRARAGVLTGEAAVALNATNQGMVAGDLVNTASRIQAAAQLGTVLVGDETKRATESAIEYEAVGPHELKGKALPIDLWRAVRVVGLVGGTVRALEIEPPFVGRESELRLTKQLYHATTDERRPHLVSVIGIGGIGKSRLVWEFEKYIDGLAGGSWWHRGRCLAYGDGVAFWALGEMVRMRAGIVEDEETATALPKLRAALDEHIPDPDERRFVEPRLAQLLGMEARGPGDQENLFSAWRIFFERLADTAPTILVFEDLHWADDSLLDFVEYLLDWSRDRPIFILTTARPELLERRTTWGAAKRSFTSLFLEPLTAPQLERLLEGAVTGLPAELRAQILERSEGIPFYAVETVRMLIDRGLLARDGNAYRPTAPIETLDVPSSLQALIAARLDHLSTDERRVLQDASVLGRTFTVPALQVVSRLGEPELREILGSLVRKEILSLRTDPLSPERGQYGFLQDLVRRVAYEMMSRRDRRPRHLAAAAHLASVAGDEDDDVIEVIATHLLDAYESVPDAEDAQAVRARAHQAQERAGERAASLGANLAAQRYFERAASLADDPLAHAELIERAGLMAAAGARTEEAAGFFDDARRRFEAAGAAHAAARVSARAAEKLWDLGRLRDGLTSMDEAFEVLSEDAPDADLAQLAAQIGRFAFFFGERDVGAKRIEAALDIAEHLDLPEVYSQALNTKALILSSHGRLRESRALLREALAVAVDHDKPSAALRAHNNLADFMCQDDRYADAQRHVDEGLLLARRVGNRYWEQISLGFIYPRFALGAWTEALASMDELGGWDEHIRSRTAFTQGFVAFGVAIHLQQGDRAGAERLLSSFAILADSADVQERAEYLTATAIKLTTSGDYAGAREAAAAAMAFASDLGANDFRIAESRVIATDAAISLGDLDGAEALLEGTGDDRAGQRRHFWLAHAMRLRARLATARGETAGVEDARKGAIGLFREIEYPLWTAVTLHEQASWLLDQERGSDAEPLIAEARQIFTSLGATPWLARVDALGIGTARKVASAG
jgi:class 3 adenylate cyclase/tetratricopeptide (TPR) repeat protein